MSKLIVNRIKNYLDKTFKGKIDISDLNPKISEEDKEKNFLSRALSAYSLTIEAIADVETAALSITDGFDDNGIDAIYSIDLQKLFGWFSQNL